MIPESQTGNIFTTITTNDPQYNFKQPLIQNGMIVARDTPGFTPNNFIITLFKNETRRFTYCNYFRLPLPWWFIPGRRPGRQFEGHLES